MEKRELDIYDLARLVDRKFNQMFYDGEPYMGETEYYPYRIYANGTMICQRPMDKTLYKLSWSLGADNSVTFSDKATWEKVEESYISTGEIGARSTIPYSKTGVHGREERFYQNVEARATEDGNGVNGTAIITNSRTLLFTTADGRKIYEEISPDAVTNFDFTKRDVISTFNHDFNMVLARTDAGNLILSKSANGLDYSIPTLPNTSYANDLKENLRVKNVKGSSFMFTIAEGGETWTEVEGGMLRTITAFDEVFELGPVTLPAYNDTTAAQRSFENIKPLEVKEVKNDLWKREIKSLERKARMRKYKV